MACVMFLLLLLKLTILYFVPSLDLALTAVWLSLDNSNQSPGPIPWALFLGNARILCNAWELSKSKKWQTSPAISLTLGIIPDESMTLSTRSYQKERLHSMIEKMGRFYFIKKGWNKMTRNHPRSNVGIHLRSEYRILGIKWQKDV